MITLYILLYVIGCYLTLTDKELDEHFPEGIHPVLIVLLANIPLALTGLYAWLMVIRVRQGIRIYFAKRMLRKLGKRDGEDYIGQIFGRDEK
jgi:hypothetical protein